MRVLATLVIGLLMAVALALAAIWQIYGGAGEPYPDLTGSPRYAGGVLERVYEGPEAAGAVATSSTGRIFFTLHPEGRPPGPRLFELTDGRAAPYPQPEFQAAHFVTPFGLAVADGALWVVDHGEHGAQGAQLFAFDLGNGALRHHHEFSPEIAPRGSYFRDVEVTRDGRVAVIADASFWRRTPGLVVHFTETPERDLRRLDDHPSVSPEPWLVRSRVEDMVYFGGLVAFEVGVVGLSLSPDDARLVFGALTHDSSFEVPLDVLTSGSDAEVEAAVHRIGPKPLSSGLAVDSEGHVLMTDVEHGAIVRQSPKGELETLVKSPRLLWPSSLDFGPGGWLYVVDGALPHLLARSRRHIERHRPYALFRFRPPAPGTPRN